MKLLLASVFRPFGVDDEYGRKENKLELFHNQVTREQGIFSPRYNHRSFGLYFIAENIDTPTVILDFPTLKQFRKELKKGYDYVGISFITPNFAKAKKMAETVREISPATKIILGGHGTKIPDIAKLIDCDHVIQGEGISQLRKLFGENVDAPIRHPALPAAEHKRILGLPFSQNSAVLIPGVGCPNACRFCATSHFFDKAYFPYLKTGQEIYNTIVDLSAKLKTNDFFVMDENFLLYKDRAMELMDLMVKDNRTFNFSIFSSAEAITAFGIENMVRLGVGYVWIGAESKNSLFEKTKGIDVPALIAELRRNGIFVLASSILFLEHHTKENIWEDIDFAINLKPDFTQFMQFGPLPQTKLYLDYKEKGVLREDIPFEEWHGQHRLWFTHPEFSPEDSENILRDAFQKEYHTLGPSILRVGETMIRGLDSNAYKTDEPFMKLRYANMVQRCKAYYLALTALKWLTPTRSMKKQATHTICLYREKFGSRSPFNLFANSVVYSLASAARLKKAISGNDAHNPKRFKTMYRLTPEAYREMKGKIQAILRRRKAWAFLEHTGGERSELYIYFSGKVKERTVNKIFKRLENRQKLSLSVAKINLAPLADFDEATFGKLLENLSSKCQDIRISCSEIQKKQLAILKQLTVGRACTISTF